MLVGVLILPSALFTPLQFSTHSVAWFVILGIPQAVLTACAFAMVTPVLQAVCPYRLRGLGTAMGVDVRRLHRRLRAAASSPTSSPNAIGVRGAVLILGIPTSIIGGLLLMNGARFIRNDLSLVVEELLEEQEEHRKRDEQGADTPVLQVANIDFSYGPVQVLFDVNFEIHRGEMRRAARHQRRGQVDDPARRSAGSRCPSAASCASNGRNITYVAPEHARAHRASCSSPAARACSRASRSSRTSR